MRSVKAIAKLASAAAIVGSLFAFGWVSLALLGPVFPVQKGIRLLGVTMSSLGESQAKAGGQLNLKI